MTERVSEARRHQGREISRIRMGKVGSVERRTKGRNMEEQACTV
jgi:hypothetical protein